MKNQVKNLSGPLALLGLVQKATASIVADGIWTGNDYYDSTAQIGVANGVPYSTDAETTHRIEAAMTCDGDAMNYLSKSNVKRVKRLVTQAEWEELFPIRGALYEYDGFLHAVGKFEAFCGESNLAGYSDDETCARELATLFAHFVQETGLHDESQWAPVEEWKQGLYWTTEVACTEGLGGAAGSSACDYKQAGWAGEAFPPQANAQYYGRGPFQLSWNYNYGPFSKALVESSYDGHMYLLNNPDIVHEDAYTVFASALWFYMTPQTPKPSIHDVMTGFMVPTEADIAAGIGATFGTTANIINGGLECNAGYEKPHVLNRIQYYKEFLNFFGLPEEDEEGLGCKDQKYWPTGGYGDAYGYFTESWDDSDTCIPVKWQTPYSIYTRDDYKRCVCFYKGAEAADCPSDGQASSGTSQQQEEQQQEQPQEETQQPEVEEAQEEENPHNQEDDLEDKIVDLEDKISDLEDILEQISSGSYVGIAQASFLVILNLVLF